MQEHTTCAPLIRRRVPTSQRRRDGLIKYAHDVTSQNGEDGIIHKIFDILGTETNQRHRYCVDVGAWDGRHLSNTYSLLVAPNATSASGEESLCTWKGVLIEADQKKYNELKALHEPLGNLCIHTTVSCDPNSKNSLVSILRRHAAELPSDFDFLCIGKLF